MARHNKEKREKTQMKSEIKGRCHNGQHRNTKDYTRIIP